MTDQTIAPDEEKADSGQEDKVAQTAPSEEKAVMTPEEMQMELAKTTAELARLREEYPKQLRGSKEEALRLKRELEEIKAVKAKGPELQVTDEDVEAFRLLGAKAGYVSKDELTKLEQHTFQEKEQEALDKFYQKYPEYDPKNDTDDINFSSLKEALGIYKLPPDPKKWMPFLEKAHKDITPSNEIEKGRSLEKAQALIREQNRLGNSAGASAPKSKKLTPEQQAAKAEFDKILKGRPYYKEG